MLKWLHSVGIALDIMINAIIGGEPGDTLSYRFAKKQRKGHRVGCVLCRLLDLVDRRHCQKSLTAIRIKYEPNASDTLLAIFAMAIVIGVLL